LHTRASWNPNNIKDNKLYYAFVAYINELSPNIFGEKGMYSSCIIAKNSMCQWHTDKYNIGHATLTALGDYTGGELLMEKVLPTSPYYVICIPTYNRVELFRKKTYTTVIERYNLQSKVLLLLQSDEDEKAYNEAFPELDILRTPAGLLHTVNFVADYFPKNKRIIMMHDDIRRLFKVDEHAKRHTVEDGDAFFTDVFNRMEQEGCHLGGVYPCDYPLTMCQKPEYTTSLQFIHDPLTFMINLQIPLTLELQNKSDFERSVLYYKHDKKVLRMNHYTSITTYNPKGNSGIGHRDAKAERDACALFLKQYGEYVARIITHKNGSTSMKLKDNVIEESPSVLTHWGYKKPPFPRTVESLQVYTRPNTTDQKVIDEVLKNNTYQNKRIGFLIEPTDKWLDLGANIGTFALLVRSLGATVDCVEPEPNNFELLKRNLSVNFKDGFTLNACAVSTTDGTAPLFLCKTEYNKYRHSLHISKGRESVEVQTKMLSSMLDTIDCVKMDIEGAEIPLLEQYADKMPNVKKLVFEYTFDADSSIPRFRKIISQLRETFDVVHYTKFDETKQEKYTFYPPCKIVYCMRN